MEDTETFLFKDKAIVDRDFLSSRGMMFIQEEKAELDEILAKRSKKGKQVEQKPMEEKTTLHSKLFRLKSST